jgi:hypothetical protein
VAFKIVSRAGHFVVPALTVAGASSLLFGIEATFNWLLRTALVGFGLTALVIVLVVLAGALSRRK